MEDNANISPTTAPQAAPAAPAAPAEQQGLYDPEAAMHASMAAALVERGVWTQAQADAALRGEEPQQQATTAQQTAAVPASAAPAKVPEGVDQMTHDAFLPPSSPTGYRFDPLPRGVQHDLQQETAMREMFFQHGVPDALAAEANRLWTKAIQSPPDARALALGEQEALAQLHKMHGTETENVLKVARAEVKRMAATHPQIEDMLISSGLGNSAWLVSSLYQMARAKGRA